MADPAVSALYTDVATAGRDLLPMSAEGFDQFYERVETPLRRSLVAALGAEAGREASAEALAWAWANRERLDRIEHPVAYLYRVGRSRMRRRRVPFLLARTEWADPWVEPELAAALRALSTRQRVAVVLVHGYDWTVPEVAELLGLQDTTVRTHLERGLERLRTHLEVSSDD